MRHWLILVLLTCGVLTGRAQVMPAPAKKLGEPAKPATAPAAPVLPSTPAKPGAPAQGAAQESPGIGGLKEVPFNKLSEQTRTRLGAAALSIRPAAWKHAETDNFIYHYFNSFIATPVSVEAEFFYRVIAKHLGKDTSSWERKCHIYIFEEDPDWDAFKKTGGLDPWTGGLHSQNELFIQRNPKYKWKGDTLAHETAHLVVDRFYGSAGVPLWLNEGYAEYIGSVAYSAFYRARGYAAKPRSTPIAPQDVLPLAQLTSMASYPAEPAVAAFYNQSEKLVRYLNSIDSRKFTVLLEQMGKGRRLENALTHAYGSGLTMSKLEKDFKAYATKDYNPGNIRAAPQDEASSE